MDERSTSRAEMRSHQWTCFAWLLLLAGLHVGCDRPEANSPQTLSPVADEQLTISDGEHVGATAASPEASDLDEQIARHVPDWVADAVFYQIFPERFRNGDPANDPTRESLEDHETVPESWEVSPWTGDWYERADWERELGDDFYGSGVFHRRYGGDLQGVIDKLDYLADLGINAIYFNPVFYGRSLHKYDGASMHHIDPYFGPDPEGDLAMIEGETNDPSTWKWTAADKLFLELIKEAHQRDIRVIIDGVFNHTGRDFFAFADLREKQQDSAYKDWYIVQTFNNPDTPQDEFRYKSWWGFHTLPEFAHTPDQKDLHPGPKQYVMDITRRWMDPNGDGDTSDGIDGWRLDVANEVPAGFWRDWHALVREINPEAYTVGEFWDNARDHLIDGHFSGTMNYHGFAYLVKGYLIDGNLTPHDFGRELKARLEDYPEMMQYALQNLVDSHDTDRVASMIVNRSKAAYSRPDRYDYDVSEHVSPRYDDTYSVEKPDETERKIQRLVALMQMTFVGPPMVYYGTEAGMWGADDPCCRMPMVWPDKEYDDQASHPRGLPREADSVEFDDDLHAYFQRVIQLRNESSVLKRGTFEPVASDDEAKFFAFRRQLGDESKLVAFNRDKQPFTWTIPVSEDTGLKVIATASGESIEVERDGETVTVTVPALDAVVLSESKE